MNHHRLRTLLSLLLVFALSLLVAPVKASAAGVSGVTFNNISLSTPLNGDPQALTDPDDLMVRQGDRLYVGASTDLTTLSGRLTLDDGTTRDFGVGDVTVEKTGDHEYELTFAADPSLVIAVYQSDAVPAMYIRTAGGLAAIEADKDVETTGTMGLVAQDGTALYTGALTEMKGRGNSTWGYPKKPYQIKLATSTELVPGAGAHKTWILLANYLDASLIRNQIAYNLESAVLQRAGTPDHAIKGRMIDLFIDGGYRGSYFLTEKVQVGTTRVNITDTDKLNAAVNPDLDLGDRPTVKATVADERFEGLTEAQYVDFPNTPTGYREAGYLFELDFARGSREERSYFITRQGTPVTVKAPEDANADELAFASGHLQDFEDALYARSGVNADGRSWTDYIDVEAFANYYALQELLANDDAFKSSTYFTLDRGGRLVASPLWDCDRCLGSLTSAAPETAIHVGKWSRLKPRWIKQLLAHPEFRTAVAEGYRDVVGPAVDEVLSSRLTAYAEEVAYSAKLDKLRWSASWSSVAGSTPADDIAHLRDYLSARHTAMEGIFGSVGYTRGASLADGVYTLRNGALIADVKSGSRSNGAPLQLYTANGTDAQRFHVARRADGFYTITNVKSQKAVDVQGGRSANGTPVQQYTPNGTKAQRWTIGTYDGSTYTVASALGWLDIADTTGPENGFVLNAANNGTTARTPLQISSDTGQRGQRFGFAPSVPLSGASYTIASTLDRGLVLDVQGASSANRANIRLYSDNGTRAQRFTFRSLGDGLYTIATNTGASGVVDVAGAGTAPGTNVWQYRANGTAAQQWYVRSTGDADGSYQIVSKHNGLTLDVASDRPAKRTNVLVDTPEAAKAQKFYLVKR